MINIICKCINNPIIECNRCISRYIDSNYSISVALIRIQGNKL